MEITTTAAMAATTENRFNLNNKRRPTAAFCSFADNLSRNFALCVRRLPSLC
jgi:hypothetical protein